MTSRARPRGPPVRDDPADAEEERNMWSRITKDLRRLKEINTKAQEISRQIVEVEQDIGEDATPSVAQIDALQALYREGVKVAEEEQEILGAQPQGVLENLGLLSAMRAANEASRAIKLGPRDKGPKSRMPSESNVDAPASPSVTAPAAYVRVRKELSRSGSVPSAPKEAKEPPVKIEESLGSGNTEGGKTPLTDRFPQLHKGQEVAYKPNKNKTSEGDWIKCVIMEVIGGEGPKRKYKVQDPEPDEHGAPGQVYTTNASALIPIPAEGTVLKDYPKGRLVLALYPDTTTFYQAEVVGMKGGFCRLRFEGEDEVGKEQEVKRRLVLDMTGRS